MTVGYDLKRINEPGGYKLDDFISPVPDTLQGADVLDAKQAKELHKRSDVLFIDVFPAQKRPEVLPATDLWLPKKRLNIPGSVWLSNVGYGALSKELESYFKSNLEKLSQQHQSIKFVFYCNADCWMSWNAAKRALSYGYQNIYWFPGGVDDWKLHGYQLKQTEPVPMHKHEKTHR